MAFKQMFHLLLTIALTLTNQNFMFSLTNVVLHSVSIVGLCSSENENGYLILFQL